MKAHLIVSASPVHEGETLEALCGLTIFHSKIVLMWDQVAMNAPLPYSTLLCCSKCWDAAPAESGEKRYIYGVVEDREAGAVAAEG